MQGKNYPLLARFVHLMQRERQATHGLPWMNWSAYPAFSPCRYMHASWKYRKQDATIMLRKRINWVSCKSVPLLLTATRIRDTGP